MDESILNTIKRMLGIEDDYLAFDLEIMVHINTAIFQLTQLGVGPADGFSITGPTETWGDFLGERSSEMIGVKDYIYAYTRKLFDPPTAGFLSNALDDLMKELTYRLNTQAECGPVE